MQSKKELIFKLKQIKGGEVVTFIHLGLGDQIICNGIINYISNTLKKSIFTS